MVGNPVKEVCELVPSQRPALETELPDWVPCLEDGLQGPVVLPVSRVNFWNSESEKQSSEGKWGNVWGLNYTGKINLEGSIYL